MKNAILIAIWALLVGPALAETAAEKTGVNSTLGIAPTTNDFVQEAAISDMFEIESSKMASAKLAGPEKEFADKMVADHKETTADKSLVNGDDQRPYFRLDQVSPHTARVRSAAIRGALASPPPARWPPKTGTSRLTPRWAEVASAWQRRAAARRHSDGGCDSGVRASADFLSENTRVRRLEPEQSPAIEG